MALITDLWKVGPRFQTLSEAAERRTTDLAVAAYEDDATIDLTPVNSDVWDELRTILSYCKLLYKLLRAGHPNETVLSATILADFNHLKHVLDKFGYIFRGRILDDIMMIHYIESGSILKYTQERHKAEQLLPDHVVHELLIEYAEKVEPRIRRLVVELVKVLQPDTHPYLI